jgi:hypothetical protein
MIQIIFISMLFIIKLQAAEYLMPQFVLKKSIEDQSSLNHKPGNHCHDNLMGLRDSQEGNGFLAKVNCSYKCQNGETQNFQLSENFLTHELNMSRGDGNLWAGLTTTLKMWSYELCLKKAQSSCGGLGKINELLPPEIESGEWRLNQKMGCDEKASVILSPFEKTLKTIPPSFSSSATSHDELEIAPQSLRTGKLGHKYKLPKGCKKTVSGAFCYGDCITLHDGPFKELLSSPEPLGEDSYSFCADELVKKFGGRIFSRDVVNFYCEDFFVANLKKISARGLTCASSRVVVDCSKLLSL